MTNLIREPCDDGVVHSAPVAVPCPKSSEKWVLAATILGSCLAFIDGTVVNVALPALQKNLQATVVGVQWVIEAYSLFLAALLLVGGSLGDRYGRRRIFVTGIVIFAAASAWCGLAPDIGQLIAARAIQGIGAALLVPGSLAIISNSFAEEDRGRAIGTWSGFSAITTAIGPVLGGWLVETVSWRAVFFINIPVAILVIVISLRHVPESSSPTKGRLDWPGAILATLGLGALIYGLIESSSRGFAHPWVCAALISAIVFLALFVVLEARRENPMLPLTLFRSRTFTGANLLTFLLYGALGGTMFFLPLNLIQVQRYSPTAAGAALLPFILIMFLLSRWSGALVQKYGARNPLVVGPVIAAAGFALFALPRVGGTYWQTFFPAVVLLGIGMAISVAPLTTTVMSSVSGDRAGVASGINNAVSRAAGLLAIAVLGIAVFSIFDRSLTRRLANVDVTPSLRQSVDTQRNRLAGIDLPESVPPRERTLMRSTIDLAFVDGFRGIMLTGAALAFASAITALLLIRGNPSSRRSDPPLSEGGS
ncbi:MAG: MFS transporter [Verrucomicrobia bacterium]|nr:MAG: MFS transporter [Verrucomicrobiota bacterium]